MMSPFWIETENNLRIAIVPRPRGGDWLDDDIAYLKRVGVDVLVSMLQQDEANDLGLSAESAACEVSGIIFESFPIPDRETPTTTAAFSEFVERLQSQLRAGRSVAVHCRASIGRSSLLLASLLCAEGFQPEDAFARLSKARGLQVPDTQEQVRWVEHFASGLSLKSPSDN
jgi:protein-tyrosine phosphatase